MGKCKWMLAMTLTIWGCASKPEETVADESEKLFRETVALAERFTDSIAMAPDSAAVDAAIVRFNVLLDSLNMAVPPNTDLRIDESRNDTILRCLEELLEIKRQRLESFAKREEPDTLENLTATIGNSLTPNHDNR